MECRRIIISGSVQGVGFRYYVKRLAERLFVLGTVKNLPDCTVEIIAQATDLAVFIEGLRDGPGEIRDIEVRQEQPSDLSAFRIVS